MSGRRYRLVMLGLGLIAAFVLVLEVTWAWRQLDRGAGDFGHYYSAGQAVVGGGSPFEDPGYDYPPMTALVAAPVATLPLPAARRLWFVLNLVALVGAGWILRRSLFGPHAALVVLLTFALSGTIGENLALGQVTPCLLLLIALAVRYSAKRPRLAGFALGLATAIKIWPGLVAGGWAIGRRWAPVRAAALTAVVGTVGLTALIAATLPPPSAPVAARFWLGSPAPLNQSLSAVALRAIDWPRRDAPFPISWDAGTSSEALLLPSTHAVVSVTVAALVILVGFGALARVRRLTSELGHDEPMVLLSLASLALLASPISWYHYQLVQVLPVAVVAARWFGEGRWRRALALLGLLVAVTRLTPLAYGAYVARFGESVTQPLLLWLSTNLAPTLSAVLTVVFVVACASRVTPTRRASSPTGPDVTLDLDAATIPAIHPLNARTISSALEGELRP